MDAMVWQVLDEKSDGGGGTTSKPHRGWRVGGRAVEAARRQVNFAWLPVMLVE